MDEALAEVVGKRFGDEGDEVLAILALYGDGEDRAGVTRVQRAVIELSDSDIELVRHYVDAAQRDFRDVLFWAEHPRDADEPKTYEAMRRRLRLDEAPDVS